MKKLIFVALLLMLVAAVVVPKFTESAAREEPQSEAVEDAGDRLGEEGENLFSKLKDYFATHESGEIAEHLRTIFQETGTLTDEELEEEIRAAAEGVSLSLTDSQVTWLRNLCRRYENVDQTELRRTVEEWKDKLSSADSLDEVKEKLSGAAAFFQDAAQEAGKLWDGSKEVFSDLQEMFQGVAGE